MQVVPFIFLPAALYSIVDGCRRAVIEADGHALSTGRALLYLDVSENHLQPRATASISICHGCPAEMIVTSVVSIEVDDSIAGTISICVQALADIVVASYDLRTQAVVALVKDLTLHIGISSPSDGVVAEMIASLFERKSIAIGCANLGISGLRGVALTDVEAGRQVTTLAELEDARP